MYKYLKNCKGFNGVNHKVQMRSSNYTRHQPNYIPSCSFLKEYNDCATALVWHQTEDYSAV